MRYRRLLMLALALPSVGCGGDHTVSSQAGGRLTSALGASQQPGDGANADGAQPTEPLFDKIPGPVRELLYPMSEIDIAALIRQSFSRDDIVAELRPLLAPGRKVEAWICQVNFVALRDGGGGLRSYDGVPPVFELSFRFPQNMLEHEVWFGGHNYDFEAGTYSLPNARVHEMKHGDWVRVDGVVNPGSRIEWKPAVKHTPDILFLGGITIQRIERLAGRGSGAKER